MNKKSILFFDDEGWFAKPYLIELEKNFTVHFVQEVTNGNTIIVNKPEIKLLILDVMMPSPVGVAESATDKGQSTGIWFLKQIRNVVISRPLPVILLTNKGKSAVSGEIEPLSLDPKLVVVRTKSEAMPPQLRQLVMEMIDVWHP